jgi:hypothetical protein
MRQAIPNRRREWMRHCCEHCDGDRQQHRELSRQVGKPWLYWSRSDHLRGNVCPACDNALDQIMEGQDGREYRIAYAAGGGEWDVVDTFTATDDDAANAYAEATYSGDEWYVLDANGRNINGGRDQA